MGVSTIWGPSLVFSYEELFVLRRITLGGSKGDPDVDTCKDPLPVPGGLSTQSFRTLVPKTILLMAFGTRVLKYWVLGPSGSQFGTPICG